MHGLVYNILRCMYDPVMLYTMRNVRTGYIMCHDKCTARLCYIIYIFKCTKGSVCRIGCLSHGVFIVFVVVVCGDLRIG